MGRVAVITGGSRGLGLALASLLVADGDTVYALSRTTRGWSAARKKVRGSGKYVPAQVDVTDEKAVRRFTRMVFSKEKHVNLLVNNAGYGGKLETVEKSTISEVEKHFRVNFLSALLMTKHFIPGFRKQNEGMILNISSMAGQRGVPRLAGYSAAKFGMRALTQCTAKENEDWNVVCHTICPGGMNTGMRASLFGQKDASRQQSADFVAGVIYDVITGRIPLNSGSDLVTRHGKVTGLYPLPGA